MSAILPSGDRLAQLTELEAQAARLAPPLLPRLQAMREKGEVGEEELNRLSRALAWRRLQFRLRRP